MHYRHLFCLTLSCRVYCASDLNLILVKVLIYASPSYFIHNKRSGKNPLQTYFFTACGFWGLHKVSSTKLFLPKFNRMLALFLQGVHWNLFKLKPDSHPLSICTWFLTFSSLKFQVWWIGFFPSFNWIFTAWVACKNPVQSRKKSISSNSMFWKSSADR